MTNSKCRGDHDFTMGPPGWADSDWECTVWHTVMNGPVWYCRHVWYCESCNRQETVYGTECPDRPEDDGTIQFVDDLRAG